MQSLGSSGDLLGTSPRCKSEDHGTRHNPTGARAQILGLQVPNTVLRCLGTWPHIRVDLQGIRQWAGTSRLRRGLRLREFSYRARIRHTGDRRLQICRGVAVFGAHKVPAEGCSAPGKAFVIHGVPNVQNNTDNSDARVHACIHTYIPTYVSTYVRRYVHIYLCMR